MSRRLWTLVFGMSLTLAACKSTGAAAPAPGQPAPGAGVPPAAPNAAPAPPQPVVTPVTPVPTTPPSMAMPESNAAPAAVPAPPTRPYQDILKLKQAGLTDEFILNKVRTENVPYQLTTSEIVELRTAGVTEAVLQAMMRSGQPPATTSHSTFFEFDLSLFNQPPAISPRIIVPRVGIKFSVQ